MSRRDEYDKHYIHSRSLTASPWKVTETQKEGIVFQPSIFRGCVNPIFHPYELSFSFILSNFEESNAPGWIDTRWNQPTPQRLVFLVGEFFRVVKQPRIFCLGGIVIPKIGEDAIHIMKRIWTMCQVDDVDGSATTWIDCVQENGFPLTFARWNLIRNHPCSLLWVGQHIENGKQYLPCCTRPDYVKKSQQLNLYKWSTNSTWFNQSIILNQSTA